MTCAVHADIVAQICYVIMSSDHHVYHDNHHQKLLNLNDGVNMATAYLCRRKAVIRAICNKNDFQRNTDGHICGFGGAVLTWTGLILK